MVTRLASSLTTTELVLRRKLGGSFTGVTVKTKELVLERAPSFPTTSMVAAPLALVLSTKLRVQAALVPVTVTVTRLVLREVADTTRLLEAVSMSLMVMAAVVELVEGSSRKVRVVGANRNGAA